MKYNTFKNKRQDLELLRSQLELERSSFISHWTELSDYILPRRSRFFITDANRGDKRNQKIIDSTGTFALKTLIAGMMSGVTSPSRPWFKLSTPDPRMAEIGSVKDWLSIVTQDMATIFLKSNLYNGLPILYGDIAVFGTSAMLIEEDFDDVIRSYPFPIGSYAISSNDKLIVDTFFREFTMTVRQIVDKFGIRDSDGNLQWDNLSPFVKNQFDLHQYETRINVCHFIRPNPDYNPKKLKSKFKRYSSCYYERGAENAEKTSDSNSYDMDIYLSDKGYDYFPVLCPRWEKTAEDDYGTDCPGMLALGDIKSLQLMHKRKAQAIEKMVNPTLISPSHIKIKSALLPGDIVYSDEREGQKGIRPLHEVSPRIQELLLDIQDHQRRISRSFYEDLFLMLSQSDRRQITAREIDARYEEKLLILGPVLERINQDLLNPLIDITFDIMVRQGLVPPAPEELQGVDLKIEYLSIMAQAQKLVGLSGIERFTSFATQITQVNPEALDKVDSDQILDVYADITSVPPGIVRTDDMVAIIRAQRANAQKMQAFSQMANEGASTAKQLSETDLDSNNALTKLLGSPSTNQAAA
jgi:hypothetical protein